MSEGAKEPELRFDYIIACWAGQLILFTLIQAIWTSAFWYVLEAIITLCFLLLIAVPLSQEDSHEDAK